MLQAGYLFPTFISSHVTTHRTKAYLLNLRPNLPKFLLPLPRGIDTKRLAQHELSVPSLKLNNAMAVAFANLKK
jgi:hypothetical protein